MVVVRNHPRQIRRSRRKRARNSETHLRVLERQTRLAMTARVVPVLTVQVYNRAGPLENAWTSDRGSAADRECSSVPATRCGRPRQTANTLDHAAARGPKALAVVRVHLPMSPLTRTRGLACLATTSVADRSVRNTLFDDCADDMPWELVSSSRPTGKKAVFYIGNLCPETDSERLSKFISLRAGKVHRSVTVFSSKIFKKPKSTGARIVINAGAADIVSSKSFWPKPLYSRPWDFDKYDDSQRNGDEPTGSALAESETSKSSDHHSLAHETPHSRSMDHSKEKRSRVSFLRHYAPCEISYGFIAERLVS